MHGGRSRADQRSTHRPRAFLGIPWENLVSQAIFVAILAAALIGWRARKQLPDPDGGTGYWLGVAGAALLLVLLLYPLRKRMRPNHWAGSIGLWFRLHMLLGLIGPLLILYHSRFTYSATNSAVALITMLVVVASGLTGRFIYGHIHRGFSQRKLGARELLEDLLQWRALLEADGGAGHDLVVKLEALEKQAIVPRKTMLGNLAAVGRLAVRSRVLYWQLLRASQPSLVVQDSSLQDPGEAAADRQRALKEHLSQYLRAIRELGSFAFYDRMFRAWHYLHLPLFLFLLAAATIHVIAVHMY